MCADTVVFFAHHIKCARNQAVACLLAFHPSSNSLCACHCSWGNRCMGNCCMGGVNVHPHIVIGICELKRRQVDQAQF